MRIETRILLILIVLCVNTGCNPFRSGTYTEFTDITPETRAIWEADKRDHLEIEDLEIGDGPLAGWGRKIEADIEVRYTDGTLVFEGPIYDIQGMRGNTFLLNRYTQKGKLLTSRVPGIWIGINGMAVGGKRRFTIDPILVCAGYGGDEANPNISCGFITYSGVRVRKEKLVVEATLTESCVPRIKVGGPGPFSGGSIREVGCDRLPTRQRRPEDPIWKLY